MRAPHFCTLDFAEANPEPDPYLLQRIWVPKYGDVLYTSYIIDTIDNQGPYFRSLSTRVRDPYRDTNRD